MSSYAFADHDAGPPPRTPDTTGIRCGDGGDAGWLCEHRHASIAGMVRIIFSRLTNNQTQDA
eukprot:3409728-Pyramimonas_sp.AAC.1